MNIIAVSDIASICNPLENPPWDIEPISNEEIQKILDEESQELDSFDDRSYHLRRIASFARDWCDMPIEIDVGVPSVGFCPNWIVLDGNHRLAAAIFRKRENINADISGDVALAKQLFKVDI